MSAISPPLRARRRSALWARAASAVAVSPRWQAALAFGLYTAVTLWMMWPMPSEPTHVLYGGTGDPFGSLATLHAELATHQPPFLPGRLHQFAAPTGVPIAWVLGLASLPNGVILYGLGSLGGPVLAYNIFAFAAFPLSGLAMFLLVRRLTGNPWAAVLAGWIFAFYAYAQVKGEAHYELVHGWVLVLAVWRALELLERPSRRNGVLAGVAVVFAMAWTPYFILLAGIAYLPLAISALVIAVRERRLRVHLPGQAISAAIILAYLVGFYVLSMSVPNGQGGLRTNSVAELNAYSARPWEFFIPDRANPLFGHLTGPWLTTHLHGSNFAESTLYIGAIAVLLAAVGLVAALRRRLPTNLRRVAILAAVMALIAGWVSAPPHGSVLGVNVPFPSDLITHISSTWRVYARLVTIVVLGVALLAGIGLASLLRGRSLRWQAAILFVAALAIIGVDFRPHRGFVSPIRPRAIDAKLKALPPGLVAEYPLQIAGLSFDAIWDQHWEGQGHPVINGYAAGSVEEARALTLADPTVPGTGPGLAAIGVRYVLVPNNVTTVGLRFPPREFRLLARDQSGSVYGVLPRGTSAIAALPAAGFGSTEQGPKGPFVWLQRPSGTIELRGDCNPCRVVVRVLATSFAGPRLVEIRDAAGQVLFRRAIIEATLALPVRFNHTTRLTVTTSPGPVPIKSVAPTSPDERSVSLSLTGLSVSPAAKR